MTYNPLYCIFSDWLICTTWFWVMIISWWNSHGVNSTHHCRYTMASVDSKFDDLWDTDIDSLTYYTIHKNTKKATAWGISVLKGKIVNFTFFIQASWSVFAFCIVVSMKCFFVQYIQFQFKNVNALIAHELLGFTCACSQTMNSSR